MTIPGDVFDHINALRQPSIIAAIQGLSGVAKQAAVTAAQDQEQQNQADAKVSIHVDGAGKPRMKADLPLSDPSAELDSVISDINSSVLQNIDIHRKLIAKAAPEQVQGDLSSFGGRYAASRELGANPLGALIDAIRVRPNEHYTGQLQEARAGKAAAFHKAVLAPEEQTLLTEAKEKLSTKRLDRMLGKDDAATISKLPFWSWTEDQDLVQAASALGKTPDQLTPAETAGTRMAATTARREFEQKRSSIANSFIAGLKPEDVGDTAHEDLQQLRDTLAQSIPGGMKQAELDRLETKMNSLSRQYKTFTAEKKAQLDLEREKVETARRTNTIMAQSAAAAQDPKRIADAVAAVERDPMAFYTPEFTGKSNDVFRGAVTNALLAKHGRVPDKLDRIDQDAISYARLGLRDVNAIDTMASYAEKTLGVPISGAAIGRYNEAEGKLGSPITNALDLRRLDPNFRKLTPDQQQTYVRLAQNLNTTANFLLTRETKLATGGRGGQYMLPILKQTTPGIFTGGAVRGGRLDALRREFNSRLSVARENAWGGVDPLTGQSSEAGATGYIPGVGGQPQGNVISLDDALKSLKKGKKP